MKIVNDFPPNFPLIQQALPIANATHTFCYGDTIYCPDGHKIPDDIIFHESIHSRQQGSDSDAWWFKYLTDPSFRLHEELDAYCQQYKWATENIEAQGSFFKWLRSDIALALSGESYGSLISYGEAESKIRHYAKSS